MNIRKVKVIVNPISARGRGKKDYDRLISWRRHFEIKTGINLDLVLTEQNDEKSATALAKEAAESGYDAIVGIGGDGTMRGITNGLLPYNIPLLPIRSGTANDFARANGIPRNLQQAIGLLSCGRIRTVDALKVNEEIGINVFGAGGIDARLVAKVENILRKDYSFLPVRFLYAITLIQEALNFQDKYPLIKIEVDGVCFFEGEITFLAAFNGPACGGIFKAAPQADFSDGLSEVVLVKKTAGSRILYDVTKMVQGTHIFLPEVITFNKGELPKFSSFVVSSRKPLLAEIDGDPIKPEKKFEISVLPGALKIIVP